MLDGLLGEAEPLADLLGEPMIIQVWRRAVAANIGPVLDGFDEAVMLDTQGLVSECTGENIFVVRDGVIYTPTTHSVLNGITRATMIELARERGIDNVRFQEADVHHLPFDDGIFDASMAILTIHHWPYKDAGLREMRRVTRGRIVILTFDPSCRPWLTDYVPQLAALDEAQMPAISDFRRWCCLSMYF